MGMQSRSELRLWRARSSNKFQCVILAGAQQRVEGVRTRAVGSVVSRIRFTENDFSLAICGKFIRVSLGRLLSVITLHLGSYETQVQR